MLKRFACALLVSAASQVPAEAATVRHVLTPSMDLVYEPVSGRLYVSVPARAGEGGNSVRWIDPVAAVAGPATFIGENPLVLAPSDDGRYIYVSLVNSNDVARYDVATGTAGPRFSLGSDPRSGAYNAADLAVMPGHAETLVVTRTMSGASWGLAVFDNGVMRPVTTNVSEPASRVLFTGPADRVVTFETRSTDFGMRAFTIADDGARFDRYLGRPFDVFSVETESAGGRVYATTGQVIDSQTGQVVSTFPNDGPFPNALAVEPDVANNRMFILTPADTQATSFTLRAFNLATGELIGTLPGITPTPGFLPSLQSDLVRFGTDGLAFRTEYEVILINTDLVPEPTGAAVLALGAVALLRRPRSRW